MIIGEFGKFVYVTYLGLLFAMIAIYCFLQGQLAYGMMAFIISGICDLFDGRAANLFERTAYQKRYGIEIDSLCDMVNFAAVPAILIFTQVTHPLWAMVLAVIYVLAAVTRLATFNAQAKIGEADGDYFIGLPVTYSALIFPVSYLVVEYLAPGFYGNILPVLVLVVAYLFVMKRRIPKPRGLAYGFFCGLALVCLGLLWRLANG